jgi:hypothetical protein
MNISIAVFFLFLWNKCLLISWTHGNSMIVLVISIVTVTKYLTEIT